MTPAVVEALSLAAMCIAVAGVWRNNHRRRDCFLLFLVSNALCAAVHGHSHLWGMLARDAIFFGLAIHGWIAWGRKAI